jgi:hypothetical protein
VPLNPQQRDSIERIFTQFLNQRLRNLESRTLDDLKFNVVLLRTSATMLELTNPQALMRYRLAQNLERGSVTAMGTALQRIAREIAGQGSGVAGADIELNRGGRRYFIQVKSGPDTANRDIAQNISALLNSARARDPTSICLFGVCYARPEQISDIAHRELQRAGVGLKVGAEFWEFISGDPNCMSEVLELAGRAAQGHVATGQPFSVRVDAKVTELAQEFSNRYGPVLNDPTWARFLADNS